MAAFLLPAEVFAAADSDRAVINITTQRFDQLAYFPESSAPASVLSLNDAVLSAQIETAVVGIPVKVGQVVRQGDVLVVLDCRKAKATAAANAAALDLARYQYQRTDKLRKSNNVAEELLRRRSRDLSAAKAAADISEVDVEHCNITAPFGGVVQERMIDVGEWVRPGTALIRVVDLESIEVTAEVSAYKSAGLAQAGGYEFLLGERRYPLSKRAISAITDAKGRSRTIRLTFAATAKESLPAPGDSGRLIWREVKRYLPSDYLEKRNGVYGVMIVADGKARFAVTPAAQEGRPVLIELADDAKIIVKGRQSVKDGDVVEIVK